jgi:ADP-heptose:LPS heptosyltransferase
LHRIGDSIFTFNAIDEIKKSTKNNLYIICLPHSKPLYELIHPQKFIVEIPYKYFYFGNRLANSKARKILRKLNPAKIIDLTGVMTSATLIFNSKAREIIGINREVFKGIFTQIFPISIINHSADIYLSAIGNINFSKYQYSKDTTFKFRNFNLILLHPFAGWNSKEWGIKKFVELGSFLSNDYKCSIICPSNTISEDIKVEIQNLGLGLIETNSMEDLISWIRQCSMLIGNDSGSIQLAAFLEKPTFTIYGPTNPKFHLPLFNPDYHKFVFNEIICSAKKNERFCSVSGGVLGCPSYECMNSIPVKKVYEEVILFMKELNKVNN